MLNKPSRLKENIFGHKGRKNPKNFLLNNYTSEDSSLLEGYTILLGT